MKNFRDTATLLCAIFAVTPSFAHPQQTSASPPPATSEKATAPAAGAKLTLEQIIANVPRRVTSKEGAPGDMVNLILIGSEEQMKTALLAGGWVRVDEDAQKAIVTGILDTIQRTAYNAMPMSQLYLFGRPQDYGWAEGIPIHIVVERNHFRLWKAAWLASGGEAVWVGAATHDVGIEKGSDGKITHKIDPNVDAERDYVLQTLEDASKVKSKTYVLPANPVTDALTATGGSYHSDGRILIVTLK